MNDPRTRTESEAVMSTKMISPTVPSAFLFIVMMYISMHVFAITYEGRYSALFPSPILYMQAYIYSTDAKKKNGAAATS